MQYTLEQVEVFIHSVRQRKTRESITAMLLSRLAQHGDKEDVDKVVRESE